MNEFRQKNVRNKLHYLDLKLIKNKLLDLKLKSNSGLFHFIFNLFSIEKLTLKSKMR